MSYLPKIQGKRPISLEDLENYDQVILQLSPEVAKFDRIRGKARAVVERPRKYTSVGETVVFFCFTPSDKSSKSMKQLIPNVNFLRETYGKNWKCYKL